MENIPHTDHNHDDLSDEDVPDNRSFTHRRYYNCARNFHESEHYQTFSMCCNNGKIILPPIIAPYEMLDIFSDQTVEGHHFKQNIQAYNHIFSFTSIGVYIDENLATRTRAYVYDTDHENKNRMSKNESLHLDMLEKIENIINTYNPLSTHFTSRVSVLIYMNADFKSKSSHCSFSRLRDIIVQLTSGHLLNIPNTAGYYDPLQYPLLLPNGSYG
ncbi:hypothetical protein ACSBR2_001750 [Camellia fascicularis]